MFKITASHLYNYNACPHRVWRDAHDNLNLRDDPNEFVQLLWEKGTQYEQQVLDGMKGERSILDLSVVPKDDRAKATVDAMAKKEPLIYHGRLEVDELLGEPDLLELQPNNEYVAVDIKSGMGVEGGDDFEEGKLKKHYALQLALYTDALRRLGVATHYLGKIYDSTGQLVEYRLDQARGVKAKETWWEFYEEALMHVGNILKGAIRTKAALGSVCKLCVWYTDCKKTCIQDDYLSLIPELGRAKQDALETIATTVRELADLDPADFIDAKGKVDLPGIGKPTLEKFHRRAQLLADGVKEVQILEPFTLPDRPIELYFDIETDPTQDLVYLHGVVERRMDEPEKIKFHAFLAKGVSKADERLAWEEFWAYIRSLPDAYAVYYYSKYERTQFRALRAKYPSVITEEELEQFFDNEASIDLYEYVKKFTEWPTYNYSVKTLAQFLGFKWRDLNPSGAASIQWFNEWYRDQVPEKMQRILDYNEDDCIAMLVLKDELMRHI